MKNMKKPTCNGAANEYWKCEVETHDELEFGKSYLVVSKAMYACTLRLNDGSELDVATHNGRLIKLWRCEVNTHAQLEVGKIYEVVSEATYACTLCLDDGSKLDVATHYGQLISGIVTE